MSKEHANAFVEKVMNTPTLAKEMQTLGDNVDALMAVASREGFHFTLVEWQDTCKERLAPSGTVLSDEELETMAGGTGARTCLEWQTPACPQQTQFPVCQGGR